MMLVIFAETTAEPWSIYTYIVAKVGTMKGHRHHSLFRKKAHFLEKGAYNAPARSSMLLTPEQCSTTFSSKQHGYNGG